MTGSLTARTCSVRWHPTPPIAIRGWRPTYCFRLDNTRCFSTPYFFRCKIELQSPSTPSSCSMKTAPASPLRARHHLFLCRHRPVSTMQFYCINGFLTGVISRGTRGNGVRIVKVFKNALRTALQTIFPPKRH